MKARRDTRGSLKLARARRIAAMPASQRTPEQQAFLDKARALGLIS